MPLNPADRTPSTPPAFVPSQRSKGQRGYTPIKFLGSLRGEGSLLASGRSTKVAYQLDQYESAGGRTGNGAVEGPLGSRAAAGDQARLRLEDGREIAVTLQETDARGAVFETHGAFSRPAAARSTRRRPPAAP